MSVEAGPISVSVISPMPVIEGPGNSGMGVESTGFPLFGNESVRVSELPAEFQPGGKYSQENMPLADSIPLNRYPDPGKKTTAAHELQHAIVGLKKGNALVALSVNPEGSRLGWTLFSGAVDSATAAAGSVDTVFGQASGFGGDLTTVMSLGSSIFSAQSEAQAIISGFDRNFLVIASEIIALKGFLTAQDFEQVLRRAEFELVWRNSGFDLKEVLELQGINIPQEYKSENTISQIPEIPDSGTYTLIETYKDKIVTTVITDGMYGIPKVVCPRCGIEGGGHLPSCSPTSTLPIQPVELPVNSAQPPELPVKDVIYIG